MKQRVLLILLLLALVIAGCSSPDPAPEPVIDLSAYKDEILTAELFSCGSSGDLVRINLPETNYIIKLDKFKPSCELEPFPPVLDAFLAIPGVQHDLSNIRIAEVQVKNGDGDFSEYFYPWTADGKEVWFAYVEGSGYIRYNGVVEDNGVEGTVNMNVNISTGWIATVLEFSADPPSVKLYQVPVNSVEWKLGF